MRRAWVVRNGRYTFLALSHGRDLFRIEGLLSGRVYIDRDTGAVAADLRKPLSILLAVLEAESALMKGG